MTRINLRFNEGFRVDHDEYSDGAWLEEGQATSSRGWFMIFPVIRRIATDDGMKS